jgi:glutaredoxin
MNKKAVFYHAGCPVCVAAETSILELIDKDSVDLEVVHLGEANNRVQEASDAGVKSVPALVYNGVALHINHGADLSALQ